MSERVPFVGYKTPALMVGVVAALLSLIGLSVNRAQFFHSYLFAWLFWSGLSFGALVVLMMPILTGGWWGLALRNLALAALATVPLVALLFVPVLLGLHDIYGWANGALAEAPGYHHKAIWLHAPFFTARSVVYLTLLSALAILLRRWSLAQRASQEVPLQLRALSAAGLIAYVLTMNFASTDWVMSLDPAWYSTIFVVIFVAGHFLGALALLTALLARGSRIASSGDAIPRKIFNDLGSMLLAFVVFWTYVSFSQYLIIWSGNLPKEISWYLQRRDGGWKWFAVVLAFGEFLLPFALLLSREAKRNRQRLFAICACILGANVLTNFWFVAPSFHPAGISVHWLDLALFVALGGFWVALFLHFLEKLPLFPRELFTGEIDG